MERTKSPWDIHLQLMRIEKEYRRIRVYKPYTAMLLLNMANELCLHKKQRIYFVLFSFFRIFAAERV